MVKVAASALAAGGSGSALAVTFVCSTAQTTLGLSYLCICLTGCVTPICCTPRVRHLGLGTVNSQLLLNAIQIKHHFTMPKGMVAELCRVLQGVRAEVALPGRALCSVNPVHGERRWASLQSTPRETHSLAILTSATPATFSSADLQLRGQHSVAPGFYQDSGASTLQHFTCCVLYALGSSCFAQVALYELLFCLWLQGREHPGVLNICRNGHVSENLRARSAFPNSQNHLFWSTYPQRMMSSSLVGSSSHE